MDEGTAAEVLAKVADTVAEYISKEDTVDSNSADENKATGEDIVDPHNKVRARGIVIFTIEALILCMLFLVLGYLLGELAVFLEKNVDISWFFKAA